jgi:hypothetical protein
MRFRPAAALGLTLLAVASIAALPRSAGARGTSGYGGLGATVQEFYASNPHGPGTPPLGLVYYRVDAKKRGRVTAYDVLINARPPYSARERVAFMDGINLPTDARETNLNGTYCIVWRSKKLGKLIGMQYAAATTSKYDKTTAYMRAERRPHC